MTTKITFTLPAANVIGAEQCILLGEFNNWNADEGIYLTKQPDGSMTAEVELEAGTDYQYRYLLSNGRWINDDAEKVISEMNGFPVENCIVRVAAIVEQIKATKPKTAKPKPAAKSAVKAKPAAAKEELTKIEGIGKKIEALLYKHKISTYKDLSKSTITSLKAILEAAGNKYSLHNPGSWPKQAKLAAAGKWEELEALQRQLKGGK